MHYEKYTTEELTHHIRELMARHYLYKDGLGFTEGQVDVSTLLSGATVLEGLAMELRGAAWDLEHYPTAVGPSTRYICPHKSCGMLSSKADECLGSGYYIHSPIKRIVYVEQPTNGTVERV